MSWLVDTLVWTGALIAMALVLRRPVARLFGPQAAYALWALPLLRLVLPPLVLPALPAAPAPVAGPVQVLLVPAGHSAPAFDWRPLALGLWLAGAMLLLAWRLASYALMRRRLLAGASAAERHGRVRVLACEGLASPVAFGLIDPVVALPAALPAATRDLALAHELAHHARGDIVAMWLAQPVLALHWFNPLAWAGWRAMRRDQEAACDARVLAGRPAPERARYAELIAGLAHGGGRPLAAALACPMLHEKSIVHRLRSLTMTEISTPRRWVARLLGAGAVLALPLTATVTRAQSAAPVPPPPPAMVAPAAPAAPATPPTVLSAPAVGEKKVVIIQQDQHHGTGHTITIQRNGKTYVFTTDKELTPAEVDARVAKIEAEVGQMPPPGGERKVTMIIKHQGDGPGEAHTRRMVINGQDIDGTIASAMAEADGDIAKAVGEACGTGTPTTVAAASDDGARRVKMKVCADGIHAHVAEALKKARTEVAAQADMPADIKAKVLKALDEKIAAQQ